MSNVLLTIADLIKARDENLYGIAQETVNQFPLLNRIPALAVQGTGTKIPLVNSLPSGEFRAENTGRSDQGVAGIDTRTVNMKWYDASWELDAQVANSSFSGVEGAIAFATKQALLGMFYGLEKQMFVGDADVTGFDGIKSLVTSNVVDATGDASGSISDIYVVNYDGLKLIVGQDGKVTQSEVIYGRLTDGSGKPFFGYAQGLGAWAAMGYLNARCVSRVANVGTASGKTATDDMVYDAIGKMGEEFAVSNSNTAIYMSLRSLMQIRKARTATNATGAPAPLPTEIGGIPVYVCGTILNTYDAEVVAS